MKYYSYTEPDEVEDWKATKLVFSEQEILTLTWDDWSNGMKEAGKVEHINKQNCIDAFCSAHWASEEQLYKMKEGFVGKLFVIADVSESDPTGDFVKLACVNDDTIDFKGFVSIKFHLEVV